MSTDKLENEDSKYLPFTLHAHANMCASLYSTDTPLLKNGRKQPELQHSFLPAS